MQSLEFSISLLFFFLHFLIFNFPQTQNQMKKKLLHMKNEPGWVGTMKETRVRKQTYSLKVTGGNGKII